MSVVIETTLGDITVDLFLSDRPRACLNFLKLCKIKYYNYSLFHTISRGFIAQTGDPTGTRSGGESIFGVIDGPSKRYFEAENEPRIKHTRQGLISFVGSENNMIASQFFLTLGEDLTYLDEKHCVFGEVVEGFEILEAINEVICDNDDRPFQDVRISHTVVLDDPYPDPNDIRIPSRSPSPSAERLAGGRIAPDEEIDETSGKSVKEITELQAEREAKARATILEMVGDIPDADMAPPENVLFVCKLNPITNDDDLEIIFSRFGKIKSCEVIRDRKSGDSLQYAFIEFEDQKSCEEAYFKMDNILIDDRRLHVDFSQSVSKVKWLGKGRGVTHFDEKGNKSKSEVNNDIGDGKYKIKNGSKPNTDREKVKRRSRSPRKDIEKKGKQSSQSPERHRRQSRSPKREKRYSRTPLRGDKSPARRRRYSRSPDYSPRKKDNRYSPNRWKMPQKQSWNASRRNVRRYSPERNSRSFRRRSRSPIQSRRNFQTRRSRSPRRRVRSPILNFKSLIRTSCSPDERSGISREKSDKLKEVIGLLINKESRSSIKSDLLMIQEKGQMSSFKRSKSPRKRSQSPTELQEQNNSKPPKQNKAISSSKETSQSPRRSNNKSVEDTTKNDERYKRTGVTQSTSKSKDKIIKENRHGKEKSKSKTIISREKPARSDDKQYISKIKKAKTGSSKTKKSKKYNSEESDTESEEDRKKPKRKQSKKKVESSTDSSSSEESTSSSEDEEIKKKPSKKKSKKDNKEKRSKKSRKRKSSSSSSSSSDSSSDSESSNSSSSSSSESDGYKKKRSKKQRTKDNSA